MYHAACKVEVEPIQTVVLTTDVLQLFIKTSYDIGVAAWRRLPKFRWTAVPQFDTNISSESNISPESRSLPRLFPRTPPSQVMAVSCGSCRGKILRHPHNMPHPVLAMISCTPIPLSSFSKQIPQNSQHQSTAHIIAPNGPYGLAEQGELLQRFFVFQTFWTGWERGNAWNLLDYDN